MLSSQPFTGDLGRTNLYQLNVFVSELLVYIFFLLYLTKSVRSDMVTVLLWQKQRTDHQLCPWRGLEMVEGNGLNWELMYRVILRIS